jgi:hypothetical protein
VTQYCTGTVGIQHACYYKGLYFVLVGQGTSGTGHQAFIGDAFDAVPAKWRMCGWHKNQRLFQLNTKSDETGYGVYDECLSYGAIVATGHEHSYSRTYTMTSFSQQRYKDTNNTVTLAPGQTFCFVSGLGGQSVRSWDPTLEAKPWWAATAASNNGVGYGALFCTFKVNGDANRANCFYEDVNGRFFDNFDVYNTLSNDEVVKAADATKCAPAFMELAVEDGRDDAVENMNTGRVTADQGVLRVGNPDMGTSVVTAFRFTNVPLARNARLQQAQVQLFGRTVDAEVPPMLNVRVEMVADAAPIDASVPHAITRRHFSAPIAWTQDGEDFERHSVWGTADISPLINQIVRLPGWRQGNAILVTIEGKASMMVSASERDACEAPTLTLEMENHC